MLKKWLIVLILGCLQINAEVMQEGSSRTHSNRFVSPYDERVERCCMPDALLATKTLKCKKALLSSCDPCCKEWTSGVCCACACVYGGEILCCLGVSKYQPCMEALCGLSAECVVGATYVSCGLAAITAALGCMIPFCKKKIDDEIASADLELAKRTYKKKAE